MINDPIRHVVVLMLENRSFDQMLGCFHPDVNGVDPDKPGINEDHAENEYKQRPIRATSFALDPDHECKSVLEQIKDDNSGFVKNFEDTHTNDRSPDNLQSIMDYFMRGELPALHKLAENFAVCDRWFSSVPGPTWANRFFVHSGSSMGRVLMGSVKSIQEALKFFPYLQRSLYDELEKAGKSWAIYCGDIPQPILMTSLWNKQDRFHRLDTFYLDATQPERDFPEYTFIEPRYFDPNQNDDHPPHDVLRAQRLLASIYNAIRANEDLWKTTLLVVLYDEHGGFYDHVSPPPAVAPDGWHHFFKEGFEFDRLGVRVPAVFVSPWIDQQVFPADTTTHYDHTSLLRYLCEKWDLDLLTDRIRQAQSIASIIRSDGNAREDTPQSIVAGRTLYYATEASAEPQPPIGPFPLNEHQRALAAFMEYMGAHPELTANPVASAARMAMTASASEPDVEQAKSNFQRWMAAGK
jgi:phospholipase C